MKLEDLLKQLGEDMGMGEIKLDAKKRLFPRYGWAFAGVY